MTIFKKKVERWKGESWKVGKRSKALRAVG
jgi:hypothetical protein